MADLTTEQLDKLKKALDSKDGHLEIENMDNINLTKLLSPTEVIELQIKNCKNINLQGLERMQNLTKLVVSKCTFTQNGLEVFEQRMDDNNGEVRRDFDDLEKEYKIHDLEYLTEITFDDCQLTDLTPFQHIRRLETVNFPNNKISTITPLKKYRHVKEFDIHNNDEMKADILSQEGFEQFKKELMVIQMFVGLRKINVQGVPLFADEKAQNALYYVFPEVSDEYINDMQISIAQQQNVLEDPNVLAKIKEIQKEPLKDFEQNGTTYSYQDLIHHFVITSYYDLEFLYDRTNKIPKQIEEVLRNNSSLEQQVNEINTKHQNMMNTMKTIEDKIKRLQQSLDQADIDFANGREKVHQLVEKYREELKKNE